MSSKTPKRKRAAAAAPETAGRSSAPAPVVEAVAPVADAADPVLMDQVLTDQVPMDQVPADPGLPDQGPTVGLASNHTIKDAAALKDSLLQVFDEPGAVAIDAKSVERIDTAVMQLLCAFVRDRVARGHAVHFTRPTQAFVDAAQLLGVSALLALPAVDAGVAK